MMASKKTNSDTANKNATKRALYDVVNGEIVDASVYNRSDFKSFLDCAIAGMNVGKDVLTEVEILERLFIGSLKFVDIEVEYKIYK